MRKELRVHLASRLEELDSERAAIKTLLETLGVANGADPKRRAPRAGSETIPVTRAGKTFRRKRGKQKNSNSNWVVKILGTMGPMNREQLLLLATDKKRGPEHLLRRRSKDVRHTLVSSLAYGVDVTKKWELVDGKYRLSKKHEPKNLGRIGKEVSSGTS